MPRDPFHVLGLPRGASLEEIRRAYRQLARRVHPDLNTSPAAAAQFRELAEAYARLTGRPGPESAPTSPRPPREHPAGAAPRELLLAPPRPRGERDLLAELAVELRLAITGGEVTLGLPDRSARFPVQLPPGLGDGDCIRVPGRGRAGRRGEGPGDLHLEIRVQPHPFFRREALDLILELPLTLAEAHLGTEVDVPTLDGWVRLAVPPGCRGGERLRLRGRGIPAKAGAGDLYVHLCLRLPERLDAAERDLKRLDGLYDAAPRAGLRL